VYLSQQAARKAYHGIIKCQAENCTARCGLQFNLTPRKPCAQRPKHGCSIGSRDSRELHTEKTISLMRSYENVKRRSREGDGKVKIIEVSVCGSQAKRQCKVSLEMRTRDRMFRVLAKIELERTGNRNTLEGGDTPRTARLTLAPTGEWCTSHNKLRGKHTMA
jgi:hypothetical protein